MGRLAILRRRRAPVRRPDRSRRKSVDRHLRTQRPFREAVGRFGNADPSSRFPTQSNAARRPKRRRPPLHPCRGAGASRGGPATPADKATLPPTRAEKLKKQLLRPPCRQYRLRAPSFPANLRHPPDRHETARHRGSSTSATAETARSTACAVTMIASISPAPRRQPGANLFGHSPLPLTGILQYCLKAAL